ncbi:DUF4936 family protein [Massilia putida]|uniref:DUF4936 family protein n=1 Tax=Massilia putida TaxID=1141883 RepID=UPI000951B144|nr:DUF4936 family protein [Massilia putida]
MIDLYVYYKVRELDAAALAPRVRALQAGIGVPSQLKRRPDASAGLQTWMEVYPGVDDGFPARLIDAARAAGLEALIVGPRRAEIFTDLPTCA